MILAASKSLISDRSCSSFEICLFSQLFFFSFSYVTEFIYRFDHNKYGEKIIKKSKTFCKNTPYVTFTEPIVQTLSLRSILPRRIPIRG